VVGGEYWINSGGGGWSGVGSGYSGGGVMSNAPTPPDGGSGGGGGGGGAPGGRGGNDSTHTCGGIWPGSALPTVDSAVDSRQSPEAEDVRGTRVSAAAPPGAGGFCGPSDEVRRAEVDVVVDLSTSGPSPPTDVFSFFLQNHHSRSRRIAASMAPTTPAMRPTGVFPPFLASLPEVLVPPAFVAAPFSVGTVVGAAVGAAFGAAFGAAVGAAFGAAVAVVVVADGGAHILPEVFLLGAPGFWELHSMPFASERADEKGKTHDENTD
jgi:hypothetical protein